MWSSILLGVAISTSTALTSILSSIALGAWFLSGQYLQLPGVLKRNAIASASVLLFIALLIGTSYSSTDWSRTFRVLIKYRELFLLPVFIGLLSTSVARERALKSFFLGMGVAAIISFLQYMDIVPNSRGGPVLVGSIFHNTGLALLAFYCSHRITGFNRESYLPLAGLCVAVGNMFFIVPSTTGRVIFFTLMPVFFWQTLGWRRMCLPLVGFLVFGVSAYYSAPDFHNRTNTDWADVQGADANVIATQSKDLRFEFWRHSMEIIYKSPVFGHGTGSYPVEYQRLLQNKPNGHKMKISGDPHNEYLHVGVQLGIVGMALLVWIFIQQWRCSFQLPFRERYLAQGVVLTIAVGSLANSFILNANEGMLFALLSAALFAPLGEVKEGRDGFS